MRALVVVLFVVLAAAAWVVDDSPLHDVGRRPQRDPMCIDWHEGEWIQFKCPKQAF